MLRDSFSLILAASLLAGGCVAVNVGPNNPPQPVSVANRAPIVAALDYSPKTGVSKGDFITFTLVANDPEGQQLQYNWTNTKGMLSANAGQTVSWRPTKADGSFEPGLTQVTVIVSDGQSSATATANIMIDATGNATLQDASAPASQPASPVTVTTAAVPSLVPSVMPSAVPSLLPSVMPSAVPSVVPSVIPSIAFPDAVIHEIRLGNGRTFTTALPMDWISADPEMVPDGTAVLDLSHVSSIREVKFKVADAVPSVDSLTADELKQILQPAGTWIGDPLIYKANLTVAGYPAMRFDVMAIDVNVYFYAIYYLVQAPEATYIVDAKMTNFNPADGTATLSQYSGVVKRIFEEDVTAIATRLKQK